MRLITRDGQCFLDWLSRIYVWNHGGCRRRCWYRFSTTGGSISDSGRHGERRVWWALTWDSRVMIEVGDLVSGIPDLVYILCAGWHLVSSPNARYYSKSSLHIYGDLLYDQYMATHQSLFSNRCYLMVSPHSTLRTYIKPHLRHGRPDQTKPTRPDSTPYRKPYL